MRLIPGATISEKSPTQCTRRFPHGHAWVYHGRHIETSSRLTRLRPIHVLDSRFLFVHGSYTIALSVVCTQEDRLSLSLVATLLQMIASVHTNTPLPLLGIHFAQGKQSSILRPFSTTFPRPKGSTAEAIGSCHITSPCVNGAMPASINSNPTHPMTSNRSGTRWQTSTHLAPSATHGSWKCRSMLLDA